MICIYKQLIDPNYLHIKTVYLLVMHFQFRIYLFYIILTNIIRNVTILYPLHNIRDMVNINFEILFRAIFVFLLQSFFTYLYSLILIFVHHASMLPFLIFFQFHNKILIVHFMKSLPFQLYPSKFTNKG